MAKQLYSSFAAASTPQPPAPGLGSYSSSRSLSTEAYHPEAASIRYLSGSEILAASNPSKYSFSSYLTQSNPMRYSAAASRISASLSQSSWSGVDVDSPIDSVVAGFKRSSDALYHQTILGAHNTIGQSEAWHTTDSLAKRLRHESASNLPVYPQRPGEKDCAHYMLTRTCKFGDSCKFDHPIWVPEGGIPDWKEVPPIDENLPERPSEPDCPYFLKTGRCKFGMKCKFNHPNDGRANVGAINNVDVSILPERPSEPPCAFYLKTGKCKFGATCKFNHPKDIQLPSSVQENGNSEQINAATKITGVTGDAKPTKALVSPAPLIAFNSKELPIRLGAEDCPFYLKTGSCKYGSSCRYNHPDRSAINPPAAAVGHPIVAPQTTDLSFGVVSPATSLFKNIEPRLTQPTFQLGVATAIYPQRPGQTECDYYMKTGICKFGDRCKFHHPIDRTPKLTPAGLPRREGVTMCPYYLKTGTCKFGATCKFDHPPPGEVMAMAASRGTSSSGEEAKGESKGDERDANDVQEEHP